MSQLKWRYRVARRRKGIFRLQRRLCIVLHGMKWVGNYTNENTRIRTQNTHMKSAAGAGWFLFEPRLGENPLLKKCVACSCSVFGFCACVASDLWLLTFRTFGCVSFVSTLCSAQPISIHCWANLIVLAGVWSIVSGTEQLSKFAWLYTSSCIVGGIIASGDLTRLNKTGVSSSFIK